MLVTSVEGSKISQVRPSDPNAQPDKPESSASLQEPRVKTGEKVSKEKEESVEITQEMLDVVGENFKLIHKVDLQFSIHKDTGRTFVRVINSDTGKTVREIPPEQILNLMAKIDEMMGILYDQKV